MNIKIGIPRALLFYEYSPMWISFFNELGTDVVISPKTNKKILNDGTITTVEDACIPVKIYNGHVINLRTKVDYLFVPRIIGVYKNEYICPKFCGLPEMVKYSLSDLPQMINTKIDLRKKDKMKDAMLEIGAFITKDKKRILNSYHIAQDNYLVHKNSQKKKWTKSSKNIMLMGHPYVLDDDFLNMNIKNKLLEEGYQYITPDMLDEGIINEYALKYHDKLFWLFFRQMIGTCLYMMENKIVDGVIYISSFGCGIDSVVAETVERKIRRESDIPFMLLIIDEHSGEAGFNTRLEAFMDMLKWRNQNENHLSTHGNYVYSH